MKKPCDFSQGFHQYPQGEHHHYKSKITPNHPICQALAATFSVANKHQNGKIGVKIGVKIGARSVQEIKNGAPLPGVVLAVRCTVIIFVFRREADAIQGQEPPAGFSERLGEGEAQDRLDGLGRAETEVPMGPAQGVASLDGRHQGIPEVHQVQQRPPGHHRLPPPGPGHEVV
jgi:hypothetical protein